MPITQHDLNSYKMSETLKNDTFIDIIELCKMIKVQDVRTAIKWCEEFKIPILFMAKKRVTYRFLVEAELDKQIIKKFKQQSPENWEYLYQCYRRNDLENYSIEMQTNRAKKQKIRTIRKPQSKNAKNLLKD